MDTVTETRWIVDTYRLPAVEVREVEWERDTCSLGLHETQAKAWEAAEEHVLTYLRDVHAAKRIVVQDLNRRIDQAESCLRYARQRITETTA